MNFNRYIRKKTIEKIKTNRATDRPIFIVCDKLLAHNTEFVQN